MEALVNKKHRRIIHSHVLLQLCMFAGMIAPLIIAFFGFLFFFGMYPFSVLPLVIVWFISSVALIVDYTYARLRSK
jgi:hypothetical protein